MASNNALVTPGRSSPLTVTSRVLVLAGVRSATAPRYRAGSSAPARVSPCDQVADGAEIVLRPAGAHGEKPGADGMQLLGGRGVVLDVFGEPARLGGNASRALYLARVPADPSA